MNEDQVNITEYATGARGIQGGSEPSLGCQTVEIEEAEKEFSSKNFDPRTSFVRVIATVDCRVSFKGSVSEDSTLLPAGVVEYFGVRSENGCNLTVKKL